MERTDLGRIVAFTDGVMAVAITLLVLNIDVPEVEPGDLGNALRNLDTSILAYVLAFLLIGRFWVLHHNMFESLERFDTLLMALNLWFLMLICLLPFATDLLDEYPREPIANATFAAILSLVALANWAMSAHAIRSGFAKAPLPGTTTPLGSVVALGLTFVYALSIPVAFVTVTASQLLWAATVVLRYPLRNLAERLSRSDSTR